jgi:GntR family transcriptional regulator / MocR family aminotransferase
MRRTSTSYLPAIALEDRQEIPIYRQLYEWFRRAISDGRLRPGQRVPSTRNLAAELQISRMPILGAFEQLRAEGYLETFVGAGTRVAPSIPDDTLRLPAKGR